VYKKDIDSLKTRNSTLQTLIHAILNFDEEDVPELVRQIRTCENLEDLADAIVAKGNGALGQGDSPDSPVYGTDPLPEVPQFEAELSGKMGDLLVEGSVKFIGGTSNLIWLPNDSESNEHPSPNQHAEVVQSKKESILCWTTVTEDKDLILHLINMYFCWHYAYFTTLSKGLFYRDFLQGLSTQYCSSLLVNAMLGLGCHFSSRPGVHANPDDSATAGDHFFAEAKRLMHENDEFATTKLCTVQALALMSVREAGCGREGKGWVYSGMSFRMAMDLGLNVDAPGLSPDSRLSDEDIDARRITFWGCFLFDKYAQCFDYLEAIAHLSH
jgi:Fungal specific transcription factor domain